MYKFLKIFKNLLNNPKKILRLVLRKDNFLVELIKYCHPYLFNKIFQIWDLSVNREINCPVIFQEKSKEVSIKLLNLPDSEFRANHIQSLLRIYLWLRGLLKSRCYLSAIHLNGSYRCNNSWDKDKIEAYSIDWFV